MAFLVEMVMYGGMNGGEFLQTSHLPEAKHCPLSSPKWEMRILGAIVEPAASFLTAGIANDLRGGAIGPQFVGHDNLRLAVTLHGIPEEFQRCFAIPALCDIAFQHFTFVINSTPQVVRLAVDLHENLIQVPLPV